MAGFDFLAYAMGRAGAPPRGGDIASYMMGVKSGAHYEESTGPIAHTSKGKSGAPLTKLLVDVDAVQDLHGYDHPWPAGGGVNKANLETATVRNDGTYGMSVTIDKTAETITMSGTWSGAAAGSWRFLNTPDIDTSLSIKAFELTSGSHISSVTQDGAENRLIIQVNNMVSGTAYTISFKLFAYSGTAPTAWSPYSNLCPISGWSEAKVSRTGVNVWDEEWEEVSGHIESKNYIPVKPSTNYYWKSPADPANGFFFYDKSKTLISVAYSFVGKIITTPANCYFCKFAVGAAYGTTYNHDISINYPSTDHDYHAYSGDTYIIDLDGTVYGAELDALAGKLTVTMARLKFSDLNWTAGARNTADTGRIFYGRKTDAKSLSLPRSDTFNGVIYAFPSWESVAANQITIAQGEYIICCADCADKTEFLSMFGSAELVYELATPVVLDVTPIAPTSLAGTNVVWANCGDVDVVFRTA